jgi:hypothetical protein
LDPVTANSDLCTDEHGGANLGVAPPIGPWTEFKEATQ